MNTNTFHVQTEGKVERYQGRQSFLNVNLGVPWTFPTKLTRALAELSKKANRNATQPHLNLFAKDYEQS